MPVLMYSYGLKRSLPMLSDEEFEPIGKALENRVEQIKEYRRVHQCSLDEALKHSSVDALDHYERISGIRLAHPDELYWVQLSRYGRSCPHCGKPFRTPRAKLCAECGFTLPKGQRSGPSSSAQTSGDD